MKKFISRALVAFALVFAVSVPVLADTIRLKDGSVIRGQIVSFKNEQFTILVGGGSRGRKSQITVYMEDVDSIEFDSTGVSGNTSDDTSNTQPSYQPPTNTQPSYQPPPNTQPSAAAELPSMMIFPAVAFMRSTRNGSVFARFFSAKS